MELKHVVGTLPEGIPALSEAGDDICPYWWPRRPFRRPPRWWKGEVPEDLRAVENIYRALTLFATTTGFNDEAMARSVQKTAIGHLVENVAILKGGALKAWEPLDPICPEWPWGRRRPWSNIGGIGGAGGIGPGPRPPKDGDPDPEPNLVATHLLDALSLLTAYNLH